MSLKVKDLIHKPLPTKVKHEGGGILIETKVPPLTLLNCYKVRSPLIKEQLIYITKGIASQPQQAV